MSVLHLTQFIVNNSLTVQPGKSREELCDQLVKGLYIELRATSPGKGTFYLRYKDGGKTTRHMKLGVTDLMSLAEARAEAKKQKAEIHLGSDPRKSMREKVSSLTFKTYVEDHYLQHSKLTKRSHRDDFNRTHQRLIPVFGATTLNQITTKSIIDFLAELRNGGLASGTCDRFLSLLKHMLRLACEWQLLEVNPAKTIKFYREFNEVNNYLDEKQLRRLLEVLHTHPNRLVCNLTLFLLATGCRLNEALTSTWENLDLENRTWKIEAVNNKAKRVRAVPLNDSALETLNTIQSDPLRQRGYVFINPKTGDRLKYPAKGWHSIRAEANLHHFRLHDCRHTAASLMVDSGRSLYEVAQVLGHSQVQTSVRYSHLSTKTLQDAAGSISERIQAASPKPAPPELKLITTGS